MHPVGQARSQIVHELDRRGAGAIPDLIGQDHLAVALQSTTLVDTCGVKLI